MSDFSGQEKQKETPKYQVLIQYIYELIEQKQLEKGDKISSINEYCQQFNLSRDTVMVALKELKAKGIIQSVPGKGYYIQNTDIKRKEKIFLLFDELNSFKEDLLNSFLNNIPENIEVDLFFHHFNRNFFTKLTQDHAGFYSKYIIMPAKFQEITTELNLLPAKSIYILDQINPEVANKFPAVYQNFEKDIYEALKSSIKKLNNYKKLVLIFPGGKEPEGMLKGFKTFCKEFEINSTVWKSPNLKKIETSTAFVIPNDRHMVEIVRFCNENSLEVGKEIGIISYNDTPLKEIANKGITCISTDFKLMGENLAKLIQTKKKQQIENPSRLIIRNSL